MKKVLKTGGWVLVGLFVIYTFYFLWKQSQPAPVVYELVAPEQRDVVKQTIATGTLEARTQVELKPQITGVVTEPAHTGTEFCGVGAHLPRGSGARGRTHTTVVR